MKPLPTRLLATLLLLVAAAAGGAADTAPVKKAVKAEKAEKAPKPASLALQPLTAVYSAGMNGMSLGAEVTVRLSGSGERWRADVLAQSSLFRFHEQSDFTWRNCAAKPSAYRFEFAGFGIDRSLFLDFDHEKAVATGLSRRGPVSYPLPKFLVDELSLTQAARCRLARGDRELSFDVATTTGMKRQQWKVEGNEKVDTPWGMLDSVRVVRIRDAEDSARKSTMWVAPALGWLAVRVEHQEKLGVKGTIAIKSLSGVPTPPLKK